MYSSMTKELQKSYAITIDQKPYLKLVPHLLRTDRTKWITQKSVSSIAWVSSR
jgi:hypothetical protein